MSRDPASAARDLLGASPERVEPLVSFPDRASYRVTLNGERFAVKIDDDHATVAHEVAGHRRAAAAGVRVPELLAATEGAFAMRWVDGVVLRDVGSLAAWRDAGTQVRVAHDVGSGPPFGTGFGGFNPTRPTWRAFFELFAETMLAECERDLGLSREHGDRIRAAVRDAPGLDAPHIVWCHGDLQPEHVLIDPPTEQVAAIIDWADQGAGDFGWDVAVLTIDHTPCRAAFLDGYGATREQRAALDALLPLYSVVRLVGEASWFAEHGFPYADNLRRAAEWLI